MSNFGTLYLRSIPWDQELLIFLVFYSNLFLLETNSQVVSQSWPQLGLGHPELGQTSHDGRPDVSSQ